MVKKHMWFPNPAKKPVQIAWVCLDGQISAQSNIWCRKFNQSFSQPMWMGEDSARAKQSLKLDFLLARRMKIRVRHQNVNILEISSFAEGASIYH